MCILKCPSKFLSSFWHQNASKCHMPRSVSSCLWAIFIQASPSRSSIAGMTYIYMATEGGDWVWNICIDMIQHVFTVLRFDTMPNNASARHFKVSVSDSYLIGLVCVSDHWCVQCNATSPNLGLMNLKSGAKTFKNLHSPPLLPWKYEPRAGAQ